MAKKESSLGTWEEVVVDFFEKRISESALFKARSSLEETKNKIQSEKDPKKIERLKKMLDEKHSILEEIRTRAPSNEIRDWINRITDKKNKRAPIKESHRISKATHALKFTHTSANAISVFIEGNASESHLYITTSSFHTLFPDFSHNDGALISISRFLALEMSGISIFDHITKGNFDFLKCFKRNESELEVWKAVFTQVVMPDEKINLAKAKQLYFPTSKQKEKDDYHLLIPLFASSISQKIYDTVKEYDLSHKRNNLFQLKQQISFPNVGASHFGGDYPRNVSMLNANRGGIGYLFSSQPPTWQSRLKPPIYKKSLFGELFNKAIQIEVDYLRSHLLLGLSIKDPKRKVHIEQWIHNIIDEFLFYVASIQNLSAGWSAKDDIRLKLEHQYLLDPYREDKNFNINRRNTDWQSVICTDFSRWLNKMLKGTDKLFTPKVEHDRLWKNLLKQPLREHMELIEAEKKRMVADREEIK